MNPPFVSVIIPTRNRVAYLENLLLSLEESEYRHFEIIVVDDASEKDVLGVASRFGCRIFINKKNQGLAYSRSRGARSAKGKYVLFIDDDNVVHSEMIGMLVSAMEQNKNLAGVGPLTYYFSDKEKIWFLSANISLATSKAYFSYNIDRKLLIYDSLYPTSNLHNCFLVRKECGEDIGWFDEEIFMSGTEFDLLRRMQEKRPGTFLATNINAKCFHDVPKHTENIFRSLGFNSVKRVYYFQRNRGLLTGRYGNILNRFTLAFIFYPVFFFGYGTLFILKGKWTFLSRHIRGTIDGYYYLFGKVPPSYGK